MSLSDREVRERVARIDTLLERVEQIGQPAARDSALAAVQGLLDLYGEGMARIVGLINDACDDATAARVAGAFAGDELVSHLLLLHGLHPDSLRERVEQALADVRPYLQSHGGNVELLHIEGGVAKVRLSGSCHGCASSEVTLRNLVDDAVRAAAPELSGIEAEGGANDAADANVIADESPLVPLRRAARSEPSALAAL
jgi:Fe-S cluster biogenesis protein NfuA